MLGVPLFHGRFRARFWRAGWSTLGSSIALVVSGCVATPGSAFNPLPRPAFDPPLRQPSSSPRDDQALGLKAAALDRPAYVRAVLDRNPTLESARQGWRAALSRVRQSGTLEDP